MATGEVLRYLRQKDSTGVIGPITWIGAEQRFVGGLRNSKVNNLEEQYILGTDTYTVTYKDEDENDIIEKNFCIVDSDLTGVTDYYKLITTVYKETQNEDYEFDGESIVFSNAASDVAFGDGETYPDTSSIYFLDSNTFKFGDDNSSLNIYSFNMTQKDELFYIQSNGNELPVLVKTTETKIDSGTGRIIVKEHIDNLLNS